MKFTLALSFIALAGRVLAQSQQPLPALPPACLLHAVNTQDNPADTSAVCGSNAQKVQEAIASMCSSSTASVAQAAFIATCGSAGHQVAAYTATTTKSSESSSTTFAVVTSTDASGLTVTRTSTATTPTNTGGAASHKGMGRYVLAIVAVAGAFAAL